MQSFIKRLFLPFAVVVAGNLFIYLRCSTHALCSPLFAVVLFCRSTHVAHIYL